jgi:hypothetical protein
MLTHVPSPQAWLAVHGPLLRAAAAHDSLWARMLSSVGPTTSAASAASAAPDQAPADKPAGPEDSPADLIAAQAARTYRAQCLQVRAPARLAYPRNTCVLEPRGPEFCAEISHFVGMSHEHAIMLHKKLSYRLHLPILPGVHAVTVGI